MSQPIFRIFTGAMTVFTKDVDGQQRKFIRAVASSSVKDLHGDEIMPEAIRDMAGQAKASAMTIFLNHSYDVPEDVFGTCADASAVARGFDGDSQPIWDLDIEASVNDTNDRATRTWNALDSGVKLGVSIGAMIEDWEFLDESKGFWGGLRIKKLNLLEASIVGIPANPRSWVTGARKAIKSYVEGQDQRDTMELLNGVEVHHMSLPTAKAELPPAPEPVAELAATPETTEPVTDATASDEPDVTAAADEPTTPEPELVASAPAEEAAPEESEPSDDSVTLSMDSASAGLDLLINAYKAQLQEKDEQISALKAELAEAKEGLKLAGSIVEKIASLPIGRKTAYANQVSSFRQSLSGIYSEEFLGFLEGTNQ